MAEENGNTFEKQYSDNHTKVYRLALSLCGNEHDAEDVCQEAFLKAFRSYTSFREESSFFTWIYRITINVAKDYMKYRSKLPIIALTEDFGYSIEEIIDSNPDNSPETEYLSCQVRVQCLHCLTECLPMKQRIIFCLAIILEIPHKYIAEIQNCSVSSVKTTLHRSRKRWFGFMGNRCQFIKKTNPCNCRQYVRFGLAQGWIKTDMPCTPHPEITRQARENLTQLKLLQNVYQNLYREKSDVHFAQRVKNGINENEWAFFR